ncbi:hypothetical protein W97_01684 [Coniosporium apollinis CBS 100218]|uniref:Uncharacterized protein n=1 Tax=Coniosporium apollinis (strain CBS 100218) TaxID=1168221 RepID=R7YKL6_CONA1|nr:uncharacterized protein W97_01684 [Coniosporium apollinis CBS 100218]EON62462.1 hypothetical protein W97_01684 [Coniosporium apollinis CBS 100218]
MCGGDCAGREAEGGLIAILRPPPQSTSKGAVNSVGVHCDLVFRDTVANSTSSSSSTRAVFQAAHQDSLAALARSWVVIHYDGDLSRSSQGDWSQPLYSFQVARSVAESSSGQRAVMDVPQALPLTVGGLGVVGRRVSLVEGTGIGAQRIAEGIIGWN